MAASLDDLLDELRTMTAVLEDIRDNGAGAGGGAGQSGGAATQGASGKASSGGPGLSGLPGQLMGGIRFAESVSDFSGLTEGLRQSNLGASAGTAALAGERSFQRNLSNAPFGDIFASNTQQVLQSQDRAQQSVSSIVESVARTGGKFSDESIEVALRRQNEIESNVQKAKIQVQGAQARVAGTSPELEEAGRKDAANAAAFANELAKATPLLGDFVGQLQKLFGSR